MIFKSKMTLFGIDIGTVDMQCTDPNILATESAHLLGYAVPKWMRPFVKVSWTYNGVVYYVYKYDSKNVGVAKRV